MDKNLKSIICAVILTLLVCSQGYSIGWTKHIISDTLTAAKKNVVINLDQDANDNLDIVVTANPEGNLGQESEAANVIWFKNSGDEVFQQYTIDKYHVGARGLDVGDLTGNGYPDIVVGSRRADSSLIWYKNNGFNGPANWPRIKINGPAPNNYIVRVVDMNGDGHRDIIDGIGDDADSVGVNSGVFTDSLRWFENLGVADTAEFTSHLIANYSSPAGIAVADFDGDSDLDVAAGAWTNYFNLSPVTAEDVRWWENNSNSWTERQVLQQAYGTNELQAVDLDQNGTIDIIGAGYKTKTLDWWSNDGSGNFSTINIIAADYRYTRNVQVQDIDGDGDLDVAATADSDNKLSWFENDGSEQFTQHDVDAAFGYAYYANAVDLDGDGDVDLVGTAESDNQLAWWENDQAREQTIAAGDPDTVNFYTDSVRIDFKAGFSGGTTSVFFNHGLNSNAAQVGIGLDHIADKGYYTILCKAASYEADLIFDYGNIAEWQNVALDETDLRIAVWDKSSGTSGEWLVLGSVPQLVDSLSNRILVTGVTDALKKYSLFTLGSVSTVSSIVPELLAFRSTNQQDGIVLSWQLAADHGLIGFDICRRADRDGLFRKIADYSTEAGLQINDQSTFGFTDHFVDYGRRYEYQIHVVDENGRSELLKTVKVYYMPQDLVKINGPLLPRSAQLAQNYPNPFNHSSLIEFTVPAQDHNSVEVVELSIFNLMGQKIKTLFSGRLSPGVYLLRWDGFNDQGIKAASGNYIYSLSVGPVRISKRLTLVY